MKDTRSNPSLVRSGGEEKSASIANMLRMFSAASDALFSQAKLHQQLVKIEWEEEKQRIRLMCVALLLGFSCFICLLIFIGILAIALTWSTGYQWLSIGALCVLYGLVTYFAWQRFLRESNRPGRFFEATRAEIAADLDTIKSQLE